MIYAVYTILVIEDFSDARDLMRLVLEAEGYRVVVASNGLDGIETARREKPDAILMDMSMPFLDGCQATKSIRQLPNLRNIPIIACSAYNQWSWRSKAILAGCTDFLTKPIELSLLLATLSRYLR